MKKFYITNILKNSTIISKTLLMVIMFFGNLGNAQTCIPAGNETAFGTDQWIGYVYTYTQAVPEENPPSNPFQVYRGFTTQSDNFTLDLGNGEIAGDSICGTYADDFAIRFKMAKQLPEGYYQFTAAGDDGFRLSLDGGATFPDAAGIWSDHGYEGSTIIYHHTGGVINLVLEYYEKGGGAIISFAYHLMDCTSTAPTGIDGDTFVYSCNPEFTLTATGGLQGVGSNYEWGTGTVVGVNPIAGQQAETLNQAITTPGSYSYWVRRVAAYECAGPTAGVVTTVLVQNITPGDPTVFGNNVWNAYAYTGDNEVLANNEYKGYYTDTANSFNTETNFDQVSENPTYADSWTGCTMTSNDNFTVVAKREGFACGQYNITVDKWDDEIWVYINNETTPVFHYNGYSDGAAGVIQVPVQLGVYSLDATSKITVRVREVGGAASGYLHIVPVAVKPDSITGDSIICLGESITLTANGGTTGTLGQYQWGTGTVGSNVIAGQAAASITVTPTEDTTYWARIIVADCSETEAATFAVALDTNNWTGALSTEWNNTGNWSCNVIPTAATPTLIPAEPLNQPQVYGITGHSKNLTIAAGAHLTVVSGGTFQVAGAVEVATGGTLTVQNNTSLLQDDTNAANTGNVTVIKDSNPLYRLDYTMWSSPVSGQPIGTFSPFTNPERFYTYGGTQNGNYADLYSVVANLTANFSIATGYLIRMPNTITGGPTGGYYNGSDTYVFPGNFTGQPNNGNISKVLNTQGNQYTAVGNPYPSPISVSEFFAQNTGKLDNDSGIYLWRKKNDSGVSSYASLSLAGFVANSATPDDSSAPTDGYLFGGQDQAQYYTDDSENWLLATGQGFIVKANEAAVNPVITFTNSMRRPSPGTEISFLKNGLSNQPTSRLWINLSNATDFSQIAVAYIDGATTAIDYGYDAKKMNTSTLNLYSVVDENNLVIQARPAFTAADVVPLGYTAAVAGQYTFTVDHAEGVFTNGQEVYIKDNFTGQTQSAVNYTFTTQAGTFNNRFQIVYAQVLGTPDTILTANNVIVYQQAGVINITAGNTNITGITIYDIRGRKLYSQSGLNTTEATVSSLAAQHEVLVVEVTTLNGKVSKKIVF